MTPKITERTIADQRAWRRSQLLEVALELALESDSHDISMTELARRAGLSRTSVYEYFSSSSDVVVQVLINELDRYKNLLQAAIDSEIDGERKLQAWIKASLTYISSGDHLLARGMNSIFSNPKNAAVFRDKHRALLNPLIGVFESLGVKDINRALIYTQTVLDTAAKNIELLDGDNADSSDAVNLEISIAISLVLDSLNTFCDPRFVTSS